MIEPDKQRAIDVCQDRSPGHPPPKPIWTLSPSALAADAKRERAAIYWADEMGLRSDHVTGTSYAPVGQTPVVRATGQRFGCNMISAITNRGALAFMVFQGKFHNPVFIDFMKRLLRQAKGKPGRARARDPQHALDEHPVVPAYGAALIGPTDDQA